MIDFGILALFIVQCAIAFATFFAWSRVKAEISRLEVLQAGITGVTREFASLHAEFGALLKRVDSVEETPRSLLRRFDEVAGSMGKFERAMDRLDGKVASLGGRMSAIVKGRKGRDDDDEEEITGRAPRGEGMLPDGIGIPLAPQNERPHNQVIPPGFGKVATRRAG